MARFDKGVSYYTSGTAIIPVHFPEDAVCCRWCPFCYKDSMERHWCRLTGEIIYSTETRSDGCPIVFDKEE